MAGKYDDAIGGGQIVIELADILDDSPIDPTKEKFTISVDKDEYKAYSSIVFQYGSSPEEDIINYIHRVIRKYNERNGSR